ncbi:MAG: hypothetical protein ACR2KT_07060 [Methylocella sp.]
MRQNDSLGVPADHFLDCRSQLRFPLGKSQPHVARHLAVRILDTAQSCQPAHDEGVELLGFEILDPVRQNEC